MQTPSHNDDAVEDGGNGNHHESFVSEVTCEEGTHSPYMNSPMNTYRSVSTSINSGYKGISI